MTPPYDSGQPPETRRNGAPNRPAADPPHPPRQISVGDAPPVRRLFRLLYLLAGLCIVLAVILWRQILR